MKSALAVLILFSALAFRWWEFLCTAAIGGLIQAFCNLGFTP